MIKSYLNFKIENKKWGMTFYKILPNPNGWTLISLIVALFGFWALFSRQLLMGLILFLLAGLMDMIDGWVARISKKETPLGAFLDGLTDRYVEFLLYLGLLFYILPLKVNFLLPDFVWMFLLVFGSLMPTYIRAYADHRKLLTDPDKLNRVGGLLERPERLGLIYLGMFLGLFLPNFLVYFIILTAVLTNLTALERIYLIIKFSKNKI